MHLVPSDSAEINVRCPIIELAQPKSTEAMRLFSSDLRIRLGRGTGYHAGAVEHGETPLIGSAADTNCTCRVLMSV